jgi:heat shock protein HslJ
MPVRPLVLATFVTVVAAGCGWNDAVDSRTATAGLPTTRQLVQEHDWVLAPADSSPTVEDENPVTLSVVDDDVSGMAPCNAYRGDISIGDISIGDDSVEIDDIAVTQRDCGGPTMAAEDQFIAALEAVDTVDVDEDDNDRLVLHDDDVRLVFRSYDADQLLTTTWSIVNVAIGGTIESVLPGTEPTLTFAEHGDLAMATGCNTVTTSWDLDGHALSIDQPRPTDRTCTNPAGVMDQEAALVNALESADRVEIAPGELTILDADDSITLVAVSE